MLALVLDRWRQWLAAVGEGGKLVAAAWHQFLAAIEGTVAIERLQGLDAARAVFIAMVAGQIDPAKGIVITF